MSRRGTVWAFAIGQRLRPRREWRRPRGIVPAGKVVAREPWGNEGCYQLAGADRRFFAAYVFELAPARARRGRQ